MPDEFALSLDNKDNQFHLVTKFVAPHDFFSES